MITIEVHAAGYVKYHFPFSTPIEAQMFKETVLKEGVVVATHWNKSERIYPSKDEITEISNCGPCHGCGT